MSLDSNRGNTIKRLLQNGKMEEFYQTFGSFYTLSGLVIEGQKIGRTIGFPTLNLALDPVDQIIPANGVYVIRVEWNRSLFNGMANIGFRPTFQGKSLSIEAHLFDFDKVLYDEKVQLIFLKKIRDEHHFRNVEELIRQLGKDREICSLYFKNEQ